MRILVISDSHRKGNVVDKILSKHPEAGHVFFLGDVTGDIEDFQYEYTDKSFHIVSGNCDFASLYPSCGIEKIGDIGVFYTHGHTLSVKSGVSRLAEHARQRGCSIALYGHTHVSRILYEDGLYIINPGSCSQPREGKASYAVIDIEKNGIMPIIIEL